MPGTPPPTPPLARPRSLLARLFDAAAMASYPLVARALGYRFRVGTGPAYTADALQVLEAVRDPGGPRPPADAAHVGALLDRAATWIVAYHRGRPVGVMALLDLQIASLALQLVSGQIPAHLDLATTRELGRLAILPRHRGGARTVMVGLLREMLAWCTRSEITTLLAGSSERLFAVYRRYNPSARRLVITPLAAEDPAVTRYFATLRQRERSRVIYTFDVAAASPWSVFRRFLTLRLGRGAPAADSDPGNSGLTTP